MKKKGNNLTDLREHNLKVILHLLKDERYCCSELAKRIGLCNSGTLKILDYLSEEGIIRVAENYGKKSVGRAPIYYTLNENFGYLLCVDLTNSKFRLLDLKLNIVLADDFYGVSFTEKSGHKYTREGLERIVDKIKRRLFEKNVPTEKILVACVATFGKIDRETGEFIRVCSFENYRDVNLKKIFAEAFPSTDVVVDNDTNIAVVAESSCGKLVNNTENSLFIKVDEGISSAMFVDGQLLSCGHGGLGGELGYNTAYSKYFKKKLRLGDALTMYNIRNNILSELKKGENSSFYGEEISFENIYEAYYGGDALTKSIVLDSAEMLGETIGNIMNVIDCSKTVISGNVFKFGKEFLERVKDQKNELRDGLNVEYSSLTEDIVLMGTQFIALNRALDCFAEKGNSNAKNT